MIQQESGTDVTIQKDRVCNCRSHTFVEQLVSFTVRRRDNCQLYFGQPKLALNSLLLFVVADLTQGWLSILSRNYYVKHTFNMVNELIFSWIVEN